MIDPRFTVGGLAEFHRVRPNFARAGSGTDANLFQSLDVISRLRTTNDDLSVA